MKTQKKKILKILVLNGPNLGILGQREPEIYGKETLSDIEKWLKKIGPKEVVTKWVQKNSEGELVEILNSLLKNAYSGLIINPAAFTHTSLAIQDALKALSIPVVEVHLSNTHSREAERQIKLTTKSVDHVIEGFGKFGYYLALVGLLNTINSGEK